MPEMVVSSWADEIEEDDFSTLPAPTEKVIGDTKILTEYTMSDDGKKTKIVRTFKVVKKMVPKSIARRKQWEKFGMSRNDRPGPNPSTTVVTDEIFMQVDKIFKGFIALKHFFEKILILLASWIISLLSK
jgi:translation initiation factor 3 subunit G